MTHACVRLNERMIAKKKEKKKTDRKMAHPPKVIGARARESKIHLSIRVNDAFQIVIV